MIEISLSAIFWTLCLILSVYLMLNYLIKPYLDIFFYKKQGFLPIYTPFISDINIQLRDSAKHGDGYYYIKRQVDKDHAFKGSASMLGNRALIKLANPQLIREFVQNPDNYRKYPPLVRIVRRMAKTGIVFVEGETHKNLRKIISNSFHFEFIKSTIPIMVNIANQELGTLISKGSLKNVDILAEVQNLTACIIAKSFFGAEQAGQSYKGKRITDAAAELLCDMQNVTASPCYLILGDWFFSLGILKSHRELLKDMKAIREMSKQTLMEIKQGILKNNKLDDIKANDLFTILLKEQIAGNESLTDDQIMDQFVTFFGAGMDTTGHLITMCLYYLARHPHCLKKLQEEIHEMVTTPLDSLDYDLLNRMKYLNGVIKESLRLGSPSQEIFVREAIRDHMLGSIKIKKGTLLNVELGAHYYDPECFTNPTTFDPDRWISCTNNTVNLSDSYEYIPFFAGVRNCIGQHLANLEARVLLIYIVKRFNFKLSNEDYRLRMISRFLYEPVEKFYMDLELVN